MVWGAMGNHVKVCVRVLLLILLLGCSGTSNLAAGAGVSAEIYTTVSRTRALLRGCAKGNDDLHTRVLLTTRNAPIGFPPPPAMTSPPPPGY